MASKFHGEFEVSADFVNGYVYDGVVVGDWLVIGKLSKGGFVALYMADDSREYAYLNLRYCLHSDLDHGISYDYEIWHVVDTPDWMPETLEVLGSIELLEHKERSHFDETLIRVNVPEIPSGFCVNVTDWGYYTAKDWQGEQPISLRDMSDNYECIEVTAADGLPTKEIDAFMDLCGELVVSKNLASGELQGWDWLRGVRVPFAFLHKLS